MEEWKKCKIGDLVEIHRGASPRPIQNYISTSGMPWVKISDATSNNSRFITITKEFIIEDGIKNSVVVNPEDLIVSNSATPGLPKIMKIQACIHDGWLYFSDYKNITRDFLYYKFFDIQKHLNNLANGSVFQNLKTDIVKNFDINLPPLSTQQKIAAILSSLDDKIELNNKINENLEQQAQALFKSWFIDFEPFDGKIPEGWKEEEFRNICINITDGVHNTVKDDPNGHYLLLSCKNIKGGKLSISSTERTIDEETFIKLRKRTKLEKGDILLSSVGTVGEIFLLNEEPLNYEFQRSVAILKPNTSIVSSAFLYESMFYQKETIIHSAHGAVQQCIFISDIGDFKTILPTIDVVQEYTNIVQPMLDTITSNQKENQKIANLLDTLLPKLMNGEIEV